MSSIKFNDIYKHFNKSEIVSEQIENKLMSKSDYDLYSEAIKKNVMEQVPKDNKTHKTSYLVASIIFLLVFMPVGVFAASKIFKYKIFSHKKGNYGIEHNITKNTSKQNTYYKLKTDLPKEYKFQNGNGYKNEWRYVDLRSIK